MECYRGCLQLAEEGGAAYRRFEGRHHLQLKHVPLRVPLWAVFVCMILLFLPIEDPREPPLVFKITLALPVLAVIIYQVVVVANDCGASRTKLLEPQSTRMVAFIVCSGSAFVVARILYLELMTSAMGNEVRTERTQRLVVGSVFWTFRFFGLDMVGFILGSTLFWSFFFFGFCGCCMFNCCGRVRLVQQFTRRRREAMPFMDMVRARFRVRPHPRAEPTRAASPVQVQNRSELHHFNPLLFLYPFCIISSCVIGER